MADDNKNPLDVLEELLNESGAKPAGPAKPKVKTEKELAAELEKKRKEFEQKKIEQDAEDEDRLNKQRLALSSIKDSDEYKARIRQNNEKQVEKDKKAVAADGFEIIQLDHTKV